MLKENINIKIKELLYEKRSSNTATKINKKTKIRKMLNEMNKRKLYLLFNYIILNIVIPILTSNNLQRILPFQQSYITLKINKTGNIYIHAPAGCNPPPPLPDEIYINDIKQNEIKSNYFFTESENLIKLLWNNNINSGFCMFRLCSNITEINLSHFDTSLITDMKSMFYGCSSLTSIDFSNFKTSKVKYMDFMFYGCSSLTSLNLSNFDTSQVMAMHAMFYDCSSLTSLNLSNFDTSKVTSMNYMFYGCSSLTSLNLSNFDASQLMGMYAMLIFAHH